MSQCLSISSLFDLSGKTALVTGGSSGIGQAEEIVGGVACLASRAGAYTNGAVIPVDGGTSISRGHRDYLQSDQTATNETSP